MRRKIDEENKVVFFMGDFPSNYGIPHIMKKFYPNYTHQVLSYKRFQELDLPTI